MIGIKQREVLKHNYDDCGPSLEDFIGIKVLWHLIIPILSPKWRRSNVTTNQPWLQHDVIALLLFSVAY